MYFVCFWPGTLGRQITGHIVAVLCFWSQRSRTDGKGSRHLMGPPSQRTPHSPMFGSHIVFDTSRTQTGEVSPRHHSLLVSFLFSFPSRETRGAQHGGRALSLYCHRRIAGSSEGELRHAPAEPPHEESPHILTIPQRRQSSEYHLNSIGQQDFSFPRQMQKLYHIAFGGVLLVSRLVTARAFRHIGGLEPKF